MSLDSLFYLFIIGFIFSVVIIPLITKIIYKYHIYSEPNGRDLHTRPIPNLLGIAFYFSIVLVSFYLVPLQSENRLALLVTALTILLYVGVRDDIYDMSPWGKIALQVLTIGLVLLDDNLLITDFHGFLGIHEIPVEMGFGITFFIGIYMINSFNLIDGVDGLAGLLSLVIFFFFGVIFFLIEDYFLISLIAVLCGSIVAFLRFNFSEKRKVFMGDTGSMLLGFFIFYFSLNLLQLDLIQLSSAGTIEKEAVISLLLAMFIYPFLDTASVFMYRLVRKGSPFSPDKNHLHHLLIVHYPKHWMVSLVVVLFTMFTIGVLLVVNFWSLIRSDLFIGIYILLSLSGIALYRRKIK